MTGFRGIRWICYLAALLTIGISSTDTTTPEPLELELTVERSGTKVTASWTELTRNVTNITIRACPKLTNRSSCIEKVVSDLSSNRVEFEASENVYYVYNLVVTLDGKKKFSKPVEARIDNSGPGSTAVIVVAVIATIVFLLLVVLAVYCIKKRFDQLKGQYEFTEMDRPGRKQSERKALGEVRSPKDVKGVLQISERSSYLVLDESSEKTNGFTNKLALRGVDEEDSAPEIDGRLQIVEPETTVEEIGEVEQEPASTINDSQDRLRPKLMSMGLSGDSDDEPHNVPSDTDEKSPDVFDNEEMTRPNLHAVQAFSFSESESEEEGSKIDLEVPLPAAAEDEEVRQQMPDAVGNTEEAEAVQTFQEAEGHVPTELDDDDEDIVQKSAQLEDNSENSQHLEENGETLADQQLHDVDKDIAEEKLVTDPNAPSHLDVEIPDMDLTGEFDELDAVVNEYEHSASSASSPSHNSSGGQSPRDDAPTPDINNEGIMGDIDISAIEND